jgi:hypothetical protein
MKFATRLLVPAALSFAAVGAIASELPPEVPFTSSASRADVRAQAVEALRAGGIGSGEVAPVIMAAGNSGLTRSEVRAEAEAASRLGLIAAGDVQVQPTAAQLEQLRMATRQATQGSDLAQGAATRVVR